MADPRHVLTQRQLELIALYASGKDYQGIAEAKFLNYHTVRHTLALARANTGAHSLTHLVALVLDAGLIKRDDSSPGFIVDFDPYDAS